MKLCDRHRPALGILKLLNEYTGEGRSHSGASSALGEFVDGGGGLDFSAALDGDGGCKAAIEKVQHIGVRSTNVEGRMQSLSKIDRVVGLSKTGLRGRTKLTLVHGFDLQALALKVSQPETRTFETHWMMHARSILALLLSYSWTACPA